MPVVTADDNQLRHLIYAHDFAVVEYTSPTCLVCQALIPHYEKLSNEEKYKGFLFMSIDADENPIAKQFLAERETPLMVLYHKATVLESNTVYTIEDMVELLEKIVEISRTES
ncbi:MAG: protein disulfide isomerase family protein [Bacteroidota bacterium]